MAIDAKNAPEEPQSATAEVLLTRTQVARRLNLSVSSIRRREGVSLTPVVVDGRHLFKASDVDRMRPETPGEIASRAFAAFNDGASIIDTVIELQQPPEAIGELHAKWVELGRCVVIRSGSGFRDFQRLFEDIDLPVLTPMLVQQCLLIVARSDDARERLRRAMFEGEPLEL